MDDVEKLKATLTEIGVPFEIHQGQDYVDVTINASASDKYVTLTFQGGEYRYGN